VQALTHGAARALSMILPEGRSSRLLTASVLLGIIVGVVVGAFEWVTQELVLAQVRRLPTAAQAAMPVVGLALAAISLRVVGRTTSPSTSDEYIRAFHTPNPVLPLRLVRARLLAGVSTIGFGGAVGLEGPSIYAGSALGLSLHARLRRWLTREQARLMLVAGAAAGVAAVFQAPATGVVFALEAPYRDDLAHKALLPALMAAAASYLTFVALPFTHLSPVLGLTAVSSIGPAELVGAVAIGVLAGVGGRLFARLIRLAKAISGRYPAPLLVAVGGGLLGVLAIGSEAVFDQPLSLGPGVVVVDWLAAEPRALWLIGLVFVVRVVATATTVAAGGTGGLFIPLAVLGVAMGRFVGAGLDELGLGDGEAVATIWPTLGLAAFLAAGYRTPLAAVVFVAEWSRGGPAVVPALIAAAVSQLVAGRSSVSVGQRVERLGHLEERFTLPLTAALNTDVLTVPPDASVGEFVWMHALGRRQQVVPVVDGSRYVGLCSVTRTADVERDDWDDTAVLAICDTETPAARPSWSLRDAVAVMEEYDLDVLAVTDSDGTFVGVVQAGEIIKLGEILDQTEHPGGPDRP
jgi:chloride channel protein, CIC family